MQTIRNRRGTVACVLVLALARGALASVPTFDECLEASDFIAHAAVSRDHGLARDVFLDRLSGDLEAIRAFPPSLRWFAHDRDDERFLVAAAQRVFDTPYAPEAHRSQFLSACFDRQAGV